MSADPLHALDRATRLTRHPDGSLAGATDAAYANMVGPFGGLTAAVMLNAALTHPQRLGDPIALTVNFAGPVADGPFRIEAVASRTNRSTQHWTITQTQDGAVATTATAVFAARRETWSATDTTMPEAPAADTLPRFDDTHFPPWTRQYAMRFARGGRAADPGTPDDALHSTCIVWTRDEPPRPLDFVSLASLCDTFFPRIVIRRPRRTPAGTVSLTTYFHADAAQLAAYGTRPVLGVARASRFGLGYHDQSAEIWGEDGALLATSHQIVYFKE